ncbi:helix-turn-helix domain-containing protein [Halopiger goleimassiliensis]|uniref:helix-turn-helix domain-containing protein n=1 Tax=Halopiger goleimassiliensis TaxID=1293048 RepID=UPI0006775961|nr:helix-turn-helix domain-containing protein [Halopiger goleimassiliensis]
MLVAEYLVGSSILQRTLTTCDEVTLRNEERYRIDDTVRLLFWMSGTDVESFDRALEADPTVTNPVRLDSVDSQHLYRVDLTATGRRRTTFSSWAEDDVILLEAIGTEEGWRMRMCVPDRETLLSYRRAYAELGCSFTLLSLYERTDPDELTLPEVSPRQREALLLAYEAGYFDVPRSATQTELADRLGISSQSVSERLRRAIASLIESVFRRR